MMQKETDKHDMGFAGEALFSAQDLHNYMTHRQQAEQAREEAHAREVAKAHDEQIKRLMTPIEITKERLSNFMNRVRQAADQGQNQILILRFPFGGLHRSRPRHQQCRAGLGAHPRRPAETGGGGVGGEPEAARLWPPRRGDRLPARHAGRCWSLLPLVSGGAMRDVQGQSVAAGLAGAGLAGIFDGNARGGPCDATRPDTGDHRRAGNR